MNYKKYCMVSKNSKEIVENGVYFCFIGEASDGHDYIDDAFKNGASLVVGSKELEISNYYQVSDVMAEFTKAAKEIYNYDDVKMNFIGLTGTNGKTSTAVIIHKLLAKFSTSAYLGTSGFFIGADKSTYTGFTTPFADKLYQSIEVANEKVDNFVMEVSSHALEQGRVSGLEYQVGVFTNLTVDHLDFHNSLEEYLKAKEKIFNYLTNTGKVVINGDDENLQKTISKYRDKVITVGLNENNDVYVFDVNCQIDKTEYKFTYQQKTYSVSLALLAEFNVYNSVMAIIALHHLGYNLEMLINNIKDIYVEGRLELKRYGSSPLIIFDFAHTPDGISKVMDFVNQVKDNNRIFVVTGSAGGRDKEKRPEMGKVASDKADFLVLTEDDPRHENVLQIAEELKSGVVNSSCLVEIIPDRSEAIDFTLKKALKNDIIVLLGKSGQEVMYYDKATIKYNEYEVVKTLIEKEPYEWKSKRY